MLQVPWDDLRYIFGEIMYGGHIVEDWDRRLANAYLLKYFNEGLLEGVEMFPSFTTPANSLNHKQVGAHAGHLRGWLKLALRWLTLQTQPLCSFPCAKHEELSSWDVWYKWAVP